VRLSAQDTASQLDMFAGSRTRPPLPCDSFTPDADGYVSRPGAAPLYARHFEAGDARLNQSATLGRQLASNVYSQLRALERLGCLQWAGYTSVDSGPWRRYPRGAEPHAPVTASVAGFGAYRTDATARLPR